MPITVQKAHLYLTMKGELLDIARCQMNVPNNLWFTKEADDKTKNSKYSYDKLIYPENVELIF